MTQKKARGQKEGVQSDAHLRGKSSFFNLTDGYAGRFIG